jgi:hypothetical protein
MLMKKILLIIIALTGIMAMQSCQYDWMDPVDYVPPPPGDSTSFSLKIIPIFDANCNASCHATGGISPDLSPANAYTDLFAKNQIDTATPENSNLYIKCASGGSMNKYCQPGDPETILQWIKEGAKNN